MSPTKEHTAKGANKKAKRKGSGSTMETTMRSVTSETHKEKTTFAIVKICLDKPITDPKQDMLQIPKTEVNCKKYPMQEHIKPTLAEVCEEIYREFDDTILGIIDYILRNNIKSIEDDKQFYCCQLGNVTNRILRLMACDFNVRHPTKTNLEFTVSEKS